jgi:hypothetical protein
MISPELDRHIAEVGALFAHRRRPRRGRILADAHALLHTTLAAGRVVLALGGWVFACTASVRWGLRLAGVPDPAGTTHVVGLACGVFAWVLNYLLADAED